LIDQEDKTQNEVNIGLSYLVDISDHKDDSSNIEQFAKLRESASPVDTAALDSFFDQLPPIPLSHLVGSWNGGFFDTGHPNGDFMKDISWIGKDFFSVDHVNPVIIERDGTRRSWGTWGLAGVYAQPASQCLTHADFNAVERNHLPRPSDLCHDI
jgi:hypothetical protein